MKNFKKIIVASAFMSSLLYASNSITRSEFSLQRDDAGNMNPRIFIPIYYGASNQFYSALRYDSTNFKEVHPVNGFSDSKNALVSSSKNLYLNYFNYVSSFNGYQISLGVASTYSEIKNNEFGYIHDSDNSFGKGADYYIAFDNEIELDIQRHAIRADVTVPIGDFFISRISTSISPFTTIKVKQSTIFKPLVRETGRSSSSTVQDVAYNFRYEGQINTGTFINIGFVASYNLQPLKYDIAQLEPQNDNYVFQTNTIDTDEITTRYMVRLLLKRKVMGGLHPSIGFGKEHLEKKNNINGSSTSIDKNIVSIGIEKRF